MIVSNITCMKTEYIRLKHAKWVVWFFMENFHTFKDDNSYGSISGDDSDWTCGIFAPLIAQQRS
ncbi:hypothetical protein LDENG_00272790 [Lucifuga dentata]|nr:hypothetical protein LDENG_00272790 [Lucifuga dentata]